MDPRTRFARHGRAPEGGNVLPRLVAAVLVLLLLAAGAKWYRASAARDAVRAEQLEADQAAAKRQAEAGRLDALREAQARPLTSDPASPLMYKCLDANGAEVIQETTCPNAQRVQSVAPRPGDLREAAEAQQRAADIARHEAEVARYTQAYGNGASQSPPAVTPSYSIGSRCEQAKRYRDDVYRKVGNDRTFALIRNLDDQVYEACKNG